MNWNILDTGELIFNTRDHPRAEDDGGAGAL